MHTIGQLMSPHIHTVSHQIPARVCLDVMRREGFHHLPVLDERGRVLGIATRYTLSKACRLGDPLAWAVTLMEPIKVRTQPAQVATEVLAKMLTAHSDCAVVIDSVGDVVGLFTERDALALAELVVAPWQPVGRVMTADGLITAEGDLSAPKALERMYQNDIRHLLVVEDGALKAVVSYGDLVGRKLPLSKLVRDKVIVARPDTPVNEVITQMIDEDIGCVPVVEGQMRPVGLVTRTDMVRALGRQLIASSQAPAADQG